MRFQERLAGAIWLHYGSVVALGGRRRLAANVAHSRTGPKGAELVIVAWAVRRNKDLSCASWASSAREIGRTIEKSRMSRLPLRNRSRKGVCLSWERPSAPHSPDLTRAIPTGNSGSRPHREGPEIRPASHFRLRIALVCLGQSVSAIQITEATQSRSMPGLVARTRTDPAMRRCHCSGCCDPAGWIEAGRCLFPAPATRR